MLHFYTPWKHQKTMTFVFLYCVGLVLSSVIEQLLHQSVFYMKQINVARISVDESSTVG